MVEADYRTHRPLSIVFKEHPDPPGPTQISGVLPYPVDFEIADYAPGGEKALLAVSQGRYYNAVTAEIENKIGVGWLTEQGLWNDVTKTLAPGLYYTTADIDISASDLQGNGVTFVSANGIVTLSGSNHNLTPWDPDQLLLFSNRQESPDTNSVSNCSKEAVKLSGSAHSWTGTVFAPRGLVEMSGSTNTTLLGSLIGLTVRMNGSALVVTYDEDSGTVTETIGLVE